MLIDGRVDEEVNIFTEEIAEVFADEIGLTDAEQREQLEYALYNIEIISENEYNAEYWRTLYSVLSALAEVLESEAEYRK